MLLMGYLKLLIWTSSSQNHWKIMKKEKCYISNGISENISYHNWIYKVNFSLPSNAVSNYSIVPNISSKCLKFRFSKLWVTKVFRSKWKRKPATRDPARNLCKWADSSAFKMQRYKVKSKTFQLIRLKLCNSSGCNMTISGPFLFNWLMHMILLPARITQVIYCYNFESDASHFVWFFFITTWKDTG